MTMLQCLDDVKTVGRCAKSQPGVELVVHFLEEAFRDTFVFTVGGDRLEMDRSVNINSGARTWPAMTAVREG
jgi:hypothetical protein